MYLASQFSAFSNPVMHDGCLPPKTLHRNCFRFLLRHPHVPGEVANNNYAIFLGVNKMYTGFEKIMKIKSLVTCGNRYHSMWCQPSLNRAPTKAVILKCVSGL